MATKYRYLIAWSALNGDKLSIGAQDVTLKCPIKGQSELTEVRDFIRKDTGQLTAFVTAFSRYED